MSSPRSKHLQTARTSPSQHAGKKYASSNHETLKKLLHGNRRLYARTRYQEAIESASPGANGCLISKSRRPDGYAQIKLRFDTEQYAPRTYTLQALIDGRLPSSGEDFSHICGNGQGGCINPDHIVIESHQRNLVRKICHLKAVCNCGETVYFADCTCNPRCIR